MALAVNIGERAKFLASGGRERPEMPYNAQDAPTTKTILAPNVLSAECNQLTPRPRLSTFMHHNLLGIFLNVNSASETGMGPIFRISDKVPGGQWSNRMGRRDPGSLRGPWSSVPRSPPRTPVPLHAALSWGSLSAWPPRGAAQ